MNKQNNEQAGNKKPKFNFLIFIFVSAMVRALADGTHTPVIIVLLVLLAMVAGVLLAIKQGKIQKESFRGTAVSSLVQRAVSVRGDNSSQHNHNRLELGNSAEQCDDDDFLHWKKQLDGFLQAGLVDKKEYQVLLKKGRKE